MAPEPQHQRVFNQLARLQLARLKLAAANGLRSPAAGQRLEEQLLLLLRPAPPPPLLGVLGSGPKASVGARPAA